MRGRPSLRAGEVSGVRCPQCGSDLGSRSTLWSRRRSDAIRCSSCGAAVRMRRWIVRTIDAFAAAAVVPAIIVAVLFWSIVPIVIFLGLLAAGYSLAYWAIPQLLEAKRDAT